MQHQYSSPELCSGAFWWVHCLGFTLSVPIYHPLVASQNHEIPWKETKTPSNTCTIWKGITSCLPLTWDEKFAYKLPSWNSFSGCFHFCVIEWLKKKKNRRAEFFPLKQVRSSECLKCCLLTTYVRNTWVPPPTYWLTSLESGTQESSFKTTLK